MASNSFATPTWIVKETSRIAQNSLKFGANVTRKYSADFKAGGAKVGSGFSLRLPQRYATTKGQAFQQQGINDVTVRFNITDQANVGISWSIFDEQFSIEEKRTRYIKPAAIQLANTIDFDGLTRVTPLVAHSVGTPGTTPTTYQTYLDAVTKLRNVAVPDDDLVAVLSPNMHGTLVGQNATIFNNQADVSRDLRTGQFSGNRLGIDSWYYDQNTWQRTTGTSTTFTPLVNQTTFANGMTTVVTDGQASSATTYNVGDIVTIASVNEINPQNYASTGQLMQLTITQQTTSVGVDATLTFQPPLIEVGTGPIPNALANVDFLPANNAPIIPLGSTITTSSGTWAATATRQGLVYNKEAFVMGMVDPGGAEMFPGAEASSVSDAETGWAATYVRQFNAQSYQSISRLDVFYGWLAYRPDWACRVQGGAS